MKNSMISTAAAVNRAAMVNRSGLLLLFIMCLVLLALHVSQTDEAERRQALEAAQADGRQAMELILRDARNHLGALAGPDGRELWILNEHGDRVVTYRLEAGRLLRNEQAVASRVADIRFTGSDQVIEVKLTVSPGPEFPSIVTFAVAKPGLGHD